MNNEVPKRASRVEALPLQQAVVPQWTVEASSLSKLKMTEFAGDPLEWSSPEWSSLFNAVIHNAPIDDNAKMSHLKTLVKGKAKAAIACLGYSGSLYQTAWDTLVRNFGRPHTVVNAQMKLIHTYPFIKSHDSAAIIQYAQLISTCVSVLHQYGFSGDLSSESVLNSALRKLPPDLKTIWLFYAKEKGYESANFSKFSDWLNEVPLFTTSGLYNSARVLIKNSLSLQIKRAQLVLRCLPRLMRRSNHPSMLTQNPLTNVLFVEMRMDFGRVMRPRNLTQLTVTKS